VSTRDTLQPNSSNLAAIRPVSDGDRSILSEAAFQKMISVERKRTERTRKPFLLMLLDTGNILSPDGNVHALSGILMALNTSTRETDVTGWYKGDSIVGVMFTGLIIDEKSSILRTMLSRVTQNLKEILTAEELKEINISCHIFPDDWDHDVPTRTSNPVLYPDLLKRHDARKVAINLKRIMDVVGSLFALLLSAPLFVVIALAIKLSSKGPVFFKQQRVGEHAKGFTLLKFRSMYMDNDACAHKEYVRQLIAGQAQPKSSKRTKNTVYKLTEDSRVTLLGSFLRRSSLDELPQLINVLKGDMSLVGPRPPISYEVEHYDLWHRRRLLEAKPGITGLWQVSGRNRIEFGDMVRLDLLYASTWSLWLDLKILFRTPRAIFQGAH